MNGILTLDSILLSTLVVLLSFVVWAGHRYITRDDLWKQDMERKMVALIAVRSVCVQDFALKKDVHELFSIVRVHAERIAGVEVAAGK